MCFQDTAVFKYQNILLAAVLGNCDHGPGQSHIFPNAVRLAGGEIRIQFDFTDYMEYHCISMPKRHSSVRKKIDIQTFPLVDSNTSCSMWPFALLSCWQMLWKMSMCFLCKKGAIRLNSTWYYGNKCPWRFWFTSELYHKTKY